MDDCYRIADTSCIISPALIVFRDMVEQNLAQMIEIAGSSARLRPHCKTHKTKEIIQLQLARGITRHKCATFAEAEMCAEAGATDICLAYSLVGPNIARAVSFVEAWPKVEFCVTGDHPRPLRQLGEAMHAAGKSIGVLLDMDTGQHRTGLPVGATAHEVYRLIVATDGLKAAGLHVYDGHQHQADRDERRAAINAEWEKIVAFRDGLTAEGWPVEKIVCGGTGSFPVYAEKEDPTVQMSPGTCVYNDIGYTEHFPDLVFPPATLLLTRVVSRPTADRVTLDLGYKAIASDPPAGQRSVFPDLPDATQVLQNEEHLVLETARAEEFQPGDELFAVPRHICPTSALHKEIHVVSNGELVGTWAIASRDRKLTI
ncbi:MAG: D-TA family PLP-dependent enzyme [Planctomycetaceae bacterium]